MLLLERIPGLAGFPQFRFRYIPQKEALPLFEERFALLQSGLSRLAKPAVRRVCVRGCSGGSPWRSRSEANEMSEGMERVRRGTTKDPTGRFAAGNARKNSGKG